MNRAAPGSTFIACSAMRNKRGEGFTAPMDDENAWCWKTWDTPLRARTSRHASCGAHTLVTSARGCVVARA